MNANYPATLVQGLLSSPSQGPLHDNPLRDRSLPLPRYPPQHSDRSLAYPYSNHQRSASSSTVASTLSSVPHMSLHRSRPISQVMRDDPAFSDDPEDNPHFSMSPLGDFLPVNHAASDVHSAMQDNLYAPQPFPTRERPSHPSHYFKAQSATYDPQLSQSVYLNHPRASSHASSLPPPRAPPSNDTWAFRPFDDPIDDFPYSERVLASVSTSFRDAKPRAHSESHPRSHYHQQEVTPTSSASSSPITPPLSLESAPSSFSHSSYSHTSYSHSSLSHSSHSHTTHSDSSHSASKKSSKKAPPPEPVILLPPPAYSALPPPTDRPLPVMTVSAPEVQKTSDLAADVPPRSTTVPAPTAPVVPNPTARPSELRKQRSRKQSLGPPPGGLDKIDELDETDPLGFAWHHDSRYEGVKKVNEQGEPGLKESKDTVKAMMDKEQRDRKKRKHAVNSNITSFSVSPGQIFPASNPYLPQHTTPSAMQRLPLGPQLHMQAPVRLSPNPVTVPEATHIPSRQPSSSSLHLQVPPPSHASSSHNFPVEISMPVPEPPMIPLQHSSRPPSIHSQSSTELPYAQPATPHPSNRAQTPPRHRLSRMSQDLAVSGNVSQSVSTSGFPNDAGYNAFVQAGPKGAQYPVTTGPPPAQSQPHYRGASGHSSRSRPPPPGLPPRLQQQQQMHSIPRPDIVLPPRHQAAKNRAAQVPAGPPQPHYLPKRLVMPTPLQPLQAQGIPPQQHQIQGMASYGSSTSANSGSSSADSVPIPVGLEAADLTAASSGTSAHHAQQQQQQKKAKEIPMAHGGRNLLRKRTATNGASPQAGAAPDSGVNSGGHQGNGHGMQVVGNGVGPSYVPSSNASAALFASKASSQSVSGSGGDSRAREIPGWDNKTRERELQKEREREWKREMAIENTIQKEREREKEKGGRKLSKRR